MTLPVKQFGPAEPTVVEQLARCIEVEEGARGVLCADAHYGYSQPVGGAVAYRDHVSPAGVGFDIGCGNKAVLTDLLYGDIAEDVPRLMDEVAGRISFGIGVPAQERADHPVLDEIRESPVGFQRGLLDLAAAQLGTVGGGNHYVDLFRDEAGRVWVGVHFGSRGFGHKTAGRYFGDGPMDRPPALLDAASERGQEYVAAMGLAGRYACAGRDVVVGKVLDILGAGAVEEIHNHHNYCVAGDQMVATADGPKRMDGVRPGDVVFAAVAGGLESTVVLDHWCSGVQPIYEIATATRTIRCSGTHPIRTRIGGELTWKAAADIRAGDEIVCARGYYPQDGSWGEDRARFVGAFLGDGWVRHDTSRAHELGLAIGTGADAHGLRYLELAKCVAPNAGWGSGWRLDRQGRFGLSCSSRSAYEAVTALGIAERSATRALPGAAFRLPRHEKLALLAGYVDADGSVAGSGTSNHGRATLASASERLMRGLRELAIACGLRITPVRRSTRVTNYGPSTVYLCALSADATAELPLWHEAKAANQRSTPTQRAEGVAIAPGLFGQRVRSVRMGERELVYDLTVQHESHSFIVEGVITHNCWRERHDGEDWWVVRKGCTPAFPGQRGFVGATMAGMSVILEGVDSPDSQEAFYSTVHGAGRAMSRTAAAGKRRPRWTCNNRDCDWVQPPHSHKPDRCPQCGNERLSKRWVEIAPGRIDWSEVAAEMRGRGIELRGANAEEAPAAYKDLGVVLGHHASTIRLLHELQPIGVAMAPGDVADPYKD